MGWIVGAAIYDRHLKDLSAWKSADVQYQFCLENDAQRSGAKSLSEMGNVVSTCMEEKGTQYKKLTEAHWDETAAFSLLPVPFCWFIVYMTIWLFRWVKSGFEAEG